MAKEVLVLTEHEKALLLNIDDNSLGDTIFPDFTNLNPECKIFNYYFKL